MKYLWGIIIGIAIAVSIIFIYDVFLLSHESFQSYSHLSNDSTELLNSIKDLKVTTFSNEEKMSSLNKRFDDLLIFGSIIITLLLAINVTVYVKAESEVERQFKVTFKDYESKIKTVNENAQLLLHDTTLKCAESINKAEAIVQTLEDMKNARKTEKIIETT